MNRNTPRLSIAARRRIVEAVQRIERPMSRRVVGNAALNDGIDSPCQHCGYQICNCGPCATCGEVPYYCNGTHAYEPPKPSARALDNLPAEPSPAGGRDPYEAAGHPWARVGMRVRFIGDGEETTVVEPTRDFDRARFVMVDGDELGYGLSLVEPAPSPVSESPAVESDEAVLLRTGWREGEWGYEHSSGCGVLHANAGWMYNTKARRTAGEVVCLSLSGEGERSLAQNACAALGIRIDRASCTDPRNSFTATGPDNRTMGVSAPDAESAARAALEAWSRREPAQ